MPFTIPAPEPIWLNRTGVHHSLLPDSSPAKHKQAKFKTHGSLRQSSQNYTTWVANLYSLNCAEANHEKASTAPENIFSHGSTGENFDLECIIVRHGMIAGRSNIWDDAPKRQKLQVITGCEIRELENVLHELPLMDCIINDLQNCRRRKSLRHAKGAYELVCYNGLDIHTAIGNYIVPMFVECGDITIARQVFCKLTHQKEYSWTSLIQGSVGSADLECALAIYQEMQEFCDPSTHTFTALLKACTKLKALAKGQLLHDEIAQQGYEEDMFIGSALVDLYAKCGLLTEAQEVFDNLPAPDVVTWTALIAGYAEHGRAEKGFYYLQCMQMLGLLLDVILWSAVIWGYAEQGEIEKAFLAYAQMQDQGVLPDSITFVSILRACSNTLALENGKRVHALIHKNGLDSADLILITALVDMYGNCGSMIDAQLLFDVMPVKGVVTWNSLIAGYARQGEPQWTFDLFEKMGQEGVQPDEGVFVSLLNACNHSGLMANGQKWFDVMVEEHKITPTLKHHSCMIDLLGRAGQVHEAIAMVEKMTLLPDSVVWRNLLDACRKSGNRELGRQAFHYAVGLDNGDGASYVLMGELFADARIWNKKGVCQNLELAQAKQSREGAWARGVSDFDQGNLNDCAQ